MLQLIARYLLIALCSSISFLSPTQTTLPVYSLFSTWDMLIFNFFLFVASLWLCCFCIRALDRLSCCWRCFRWWLAPLTRCCELYWSCCCYCLLLPFTPASRCICICAGMCSSCWSEYQFQWFILIDRDIYSNFAQN